MTTSDEATRHNTDVAVGNSMSNMPTLTEAQIRSRANEKTWVRGKGYVDAVFNLVWRGGALSAQVEGSGWEAYRVTVTFDGDAVIDADCSCPYDWGGDCKHIVATLLALREQTGQVEQRRPLAELLHELTVEQLTAVLIGLTTTNPSLTDEIESLVVAVRDDAGTAMTDDAGTPDETAGVPAAELVLLKRQIVAGMRGSIRTGYNHWGEEAWYDSDPGEALAPALARIDAFLDDGRVPEAIALLQAATDAWTEGAAGLDEYFVEYYDESGAEPVLGLAEYWAEALLCTELDTEARAGWIDYLEEQVETALGGADFQIALTAVEQGWDYPPLVAAMGGTITERGAWEGDAPHYADTLARIRLRVLEHRGNYDAYLNLAQAEGQFIAYLRMLVRLGRIQEAIAQGREHLAEPAEILSLAITLRESDAQNEAIALARHGLELDASRGKDSLAAWLRDVAEEQGQPELALEMAQRAFDLRMAPADYQALRRIAGDAWPALKPGALHVLAARGETSNQISIFLQEGMHDEAIAAVDKASWYYDDDRVIDTVAGTHPLWACHRCCHKAEAIMNAGRSKDYDVAASWLRRGRDILIDAGEELKWREYLTHIMDMHQKKYKLMPMLRKLAL